jgi:hypothetical protein
MGNALGVEEISKNIKKRLVSHIGIHISVSRKGDETSNVRCMQFFIAKFSKQKTKNVEL